MRSLGRPLRILFFTFALLVAAVATSVIVVETAWFKDWLRGYVVRQAKDSLNGELSIGRLRGNLWSGVALDRVAVSMDGKPVVTVDAVEVQYDLVDIVRHGLSISRVTFTRPVVRLERQGETWTITRLVKPSAPEPPSANPRAVIVRSIEIQDGTVEQTGLEEAGGVRVPHRVERIDASFGVTYRAPRYAVNLDQLSFQTAQPALQVSALSGVVTGDDHGTTLQMVRLRTAESTLSVDGNVEHGPSEPAVNFTIESDKLSLPEIAPLVPAVQDIALQPTLRLTAAGPMSGVKVSLDVQSTAGQVSASLVAAVGATPKQSVEGDITLRDLNLEPVLRKPETKTALTGRMSFSVAGEPLSATDTLRTAATIEMPHLAAFGYSADAIRVRAQVAGLGSRTTFDGRARAYGADATAAGTVEMAKDNRPLTYRVHGRARHLDLRRVPAAAKAPPLESDLNAAYEASGTVPQSSGKPQTLSASAQFEDSTIEGIRIAAGSRGGVDMNGAELQYQADATVAQLNLRRIGRALKATALDSERFDSEINGHVTATGTGTDVQTMRLTASGTLTDSTVTGGHVKDLNFDTTLDADTLHLMAHADVDNVDLKTASGKPTLDGRVNGALRANVTVAHVSQGFSLDAIEADATIDVHDSMVGPLAIDRANVDAAYSRSIATVRSAEIASPAFSANAQGTVALDEASASDLTFHADAPRLEDIGKLVDKPLSGIASIDGRVTGNRNDLTIAGHLSGNGVKYDANGALVLNTDYTVRLPDLKTDDLSVSASTRATFVTLAGQNINELAAKTVYEHQQVQFDGQASQPDRTVSLAGSVSLQPDAQEVRLERLDAATQGIAWQLASNTTPVIRYGAGALSVENLRLRNADQELEVAGRFGRPDDTLQVKLTNVDLAAVDRVLLRPPQFSGRLEATAQVSGTTDQPRVQGEFRVAQGGFRQFRYESLSGQIEYGGKGITLDTKLQQDSSMWFTAKGYVPLDLLKGPENASSSSDAPDDERVNLRIESSQIQLGLIQGFTTAVSNVTGTLEANVTVTGPAGDPRPGGSVTVRDAAFTVGATGVKYSGGSGAIAFQGDRVHIDQLRLVDNQKKPIEVSGDLAFHELELGGVDITVKATDFKIIDNKMGNLRVNTDLHLGGDLRYPRVDGSIGLDTGNINLDQVLASTADSGYSTKPVAVEPASADVTSRDRTPAVGTNPSGAAVPALVAENTPVSSKPTDQPASGSSGDQASPSLFDGLQMGVHVTVPNDLVIKASDLRVPDAPIGLGALTITLGGDLWVSKTPWDRPRLTGAVNTVRGTYEFQGRRFDILRDGSVRFDGLDEEDPILDIRTERLIQGVKTNVSLHGTLRKPEVVLTSNPPLEQSDILALIVFNQPANQIGLGEQVSLAQRAQSLALGAVAGQLASSIGGALDLNTFELKVAPDSGSAAQVTVGQQVSQNLFVRVEQGIGDQSNTNLVIEYQMGNWLLLQTNVREGSTTLQPFQQVQGSGVDLIFFFSY
jgi:autotransporter translocation and assembly factor TamB